MADTLEQVVQRMIDAGEPEDSIASVIQGWEEPGDIKTDPSKSVATGIPRHVQGYRLGTPSAQERATGAMAAPVAAGLAVGPYAAGPALRVLTHPLTGAAIGGAQGYKQGGLLGAVTGAAAGAASGKLAKGAEKFLAAKTAAAAPRALSAAERLKRAGLYHAAEGVPDVPLDTAIASEVGLPMGQAANVGLQRLRNFLLRNQ